jgi:hypothetical protein
MLDQVLSRLPPADWVTPAVGICCAALVLLFARPRRGREPAPPPAPERPAPRRGIFGTDPFVSGSPSDKRAAPRRRGAPVPVLLSDGGGRVEPVSGAVLDRSRGGLAIAAPAPVPTGAVLGVRAELHRRDMPWVQVKVRHCRRDGSDWVLGCQFLSPPPWNVLLLFG